MYREDKDVRLSHFTAGFCWVFAWVLRDDYGLVLRGAFTQDRIRTPVHCWGSLNGLGVDRFGIRSESDILQNCSKPVGADIFKDGDCDRMAPPPWKKAKSHR